MKKSRYTLLQLKDGGGKVYPDFIDVVVNYEYVEEYFAKHGKEGIKNISYALCDAAHDLTKFYHVFNVEKEIAKDEVAVKQIKRAKRYGK